jgi:alpha-tubulin suppressor-like RCC1 family protein
MMDDISASAMNDRFADTSFFAASGRSALCALLTVQVALVGAAFGQVAAPVLNPADGDSLAKFDLTLTCATSGVQIHYTVNGAEPTPSDPSVASGATINIARNSVVKAKARTTLGEMSTTTTGIYTLTGDISAGMSHAVALSSGGTVVAWGLRTNGRLGNNSVVAGNILAPTASKYGASTNITDGRMVAVGSAHSLVLAAGGTVWSYGLNTTGNLGDGSTTESGLAKQVLTGVATPLTGCVAVAAGDTFSGALGSNGKVYTWGSRVGGRLSDTLTLTGNRSYADVVHKSDGTDLAGINRISFASGFGMAKEPSAMEQTGGTGNVWVWGLNATGQLGQGNITTVSRAVKVKLNATTDLSDVYDISCAESHSAVVRWKSGDPALQGRVFCFGEQLYGRLGNLPLGTPGSVLSVASAITYPVEVVDQDGVPLQGVVSVAAGSAHTLALDLKGNVWAWGENGQGALGNGVTNDRGFAGKVRNPGNTGDLENIVRIAAGGTGANSYSIAVAANGKVYAWGYNGTGQLGIGTTTSASLPTLVTGSIDLIPNSPPTVSLICRVKAGSYPETVTLTAAPADLDGDTISKVEFFCQGTKVSEKTSAPWEVNLSPLAAGTYEVYAVATDSTSLTGYSSKTSFTISSTPGGSLDSDGDGLIDSTEISLGLDPYDADSDGDGVPDGADASPAVPNTIPFAYSSTLLVWTPAE